MATGQRYAKYQSLNNSHSLVSIILLNYNGAKFASLWESFFKLDYPNYEIIFVDNGSYDGSSKFFVQYSKKYPSVPVSIIKIAENVGYSRANNIGLQYAHGKYFFLVSNDVEADKNWVKNMVAVFESNKDIGVAQSMLYSLFDRNQPDFMWNHIDVMGFNHPFAPSRQIQDVFYSEGATMFIKAVLIKQAHGLFDDDYFMFFEDVDFCWRIRLAGYRVVVVPSSIAYHARGGTVAGVVMKTNPFYMYKNTRNRLFTVFKNYALPNLIRYLPVTILFEISTGIWLLLSKRKYELGLACLAAILSSVIQMPNFMKKRTIIQCGRKVTDETILKMMFPLSKALQDLLKHSNMVN